MEKLGIEDKKFAAVAVFAPEMHVP